MTYNIGGDVIEYERLKIEEKKIKSRIEELGTTIAIFMEQEGATITPVLPMGGTIKLGRKITYTYPQEVTKIEDDLTELKKLAELSGKAKVKSDNLSITYRPERIKKAGGIKKKNVSY